MGKRPLFQNSDLCELLAGNFIGFSPGNFFDDPLGKGQVSSTIRCG